MGVEQVASTIRKLMAEDEELEAVENCENAVDSLLSKVNSVLPQTQACRLVYRDPYTKRILHHALMITDANGNNLLVNPVRAALFPQYIGPPENAPSQFFSLMEIVQS